MNNYGRGVLGIDKGGGQGIPHDYTESQVRFMVAWCLWRDLASERHHDDRLVHSAARITAGSESGSWVVISEREVSVYDESPIDLLPYGLAAVRTPEWRREASLSDSPPHSLA